MVSPMVRQRIITASLLAPLVVWGVLALPTQPFALITALITLFALWEWSGMVVAVRSWRILYLLPLLGMVVGLSLNPLEEWLTSLAWLGVVWLALGLKLVLRYPAIPNFWRDSVEMKVVLGYLMLLPLWSSLLLLQRQDSRLVLLLLLLIWAADIGAFFAGRRWGQHKLAPAVSPGKSWEGAAGGFVAALVVALIALWVLDREATFLLVAAVVVGVSIIGDLAESLFKRLANVKDSGSILPGHGGLLDRIDSLITAAPIFWLLVGR